MTDKDEAVLGADGDTDSAESSGIDKTAIRSLYTMKTVVWGAYGLQRRNPGAESE